jgi:hypothetical protein
VKEYLLQQRNWITMERLLPYGPHLKPVEMLWGNIKKQELPNRCAEDFAEIETAICGGMNRVRNSAQLPFSFLKRVGLSF